MTTNDTTTNKTPTVKKRGRKPKKAPEDTTNITSIETSSLSNNINVIIEETTQELCKYNDTQLLSHENLIYSDLSNSPI